MSETFETGVGYMLETCRWWATVAVTSVVTSWRERRIDDGGLSDEVAMIAVLFLVAAGVGGALIAVLTGAVNNLDFGI